MRVFLPSPLHEYTKGRSELAVRASNLRAAIQALDRLFPGLAFRIVDEQERIRPHIQIFVNRKLARSLEMTLREDDEIFVAAALSGG